MTTADMRKHIDLLEWQGSIPIPSEVYDILEDLVQHRQNPDIPMRAQEVLRWVTRGREVLNFSPRTPPEHR